MNKKNPKITFVNADDWYGLYIDGKLEFENHNIEPGTILRALGIKYADKWASEKWMNERGSFPKYLKDVVFEND